ncbi:N-acetylglucosamine-6-phosphate deacetylase [Sphaerochaeta pleomorpha str. Grapes]|uniref:N-acetylglucosamine-6-phosphate deacetylase n=1 Tax=Sphaerochaeta pleomorpha (strain ATCC BAA-1885 / DSM 22778 / Grapes) TaxID=158190 RepID=G8QQV0_SPHPG|nr:N-acetylglucosamine-6-phosphate deacetylase [Sphaerochaeta pleomorpha]AEV28731.1 N-acetylglucosamine-6-phosphate deacetylase [Sphaerochaeta pleomorpha str. Grapes]
MKTFIHAKLISPSGIISPGFLKEDKGIIVDVGRMEELDQVIGEVVDCAGSYLSPGFIDIHNHGGGGCDYMDGNVNDILCPARVHLAHGTTSLFPTTLSSNDHDLYQTIDNFKAAQKVSDSMPNLLGLHLEGPYFNIAQKGAQDGKFLRNPSVEHYMNIIEYAEGTIKRWSLAPELPGALEMADRLSGMGILLAAGHTNATYEEMQKGFDHGITHVTHLYSGMSTITRKDGFRVLGAVESAFLIDGMTVELIADGMHLPPELLRLVLKCKNHTEICLCTDSMRGAGMKDGPSILGSLKNGQEVFIEDGIAIMPDRQSFAGSVATADRLVRVMVKDVGLDICEAVSMMSLNPARFLHYDSVKGSLEIGKDADLVVFDENIQVSAVFVGGKCQSF